MANTDGSRIGGNLPAVSGALGDTQALTGEVGGHLIPGPPGADGVSPTIAVSIIPGGHRVTITDAEGTRHFDVPDGATGPRGETGQRGATGATGAAGRDGKDGEDGQDGQDGAPGQDGADGVSPVISSAAITGGHRLTIVDAGGTTTVDVMDGADGADGAPGAPGQNGTDGTDGDDGVTFTPAVSAAGVISWTNDGGRQNPASVDLVTAVIDALPVYNGGVS